MGLAGKSEHDLFDLRDGQESQNTIYLIMRWAGLVNFMLQTQLKSNPSRQNL
jgi:hypothetical protein